jgi:RNA polymerase sigma factor (sigma-70 family)
MAVLIKGLVSGNKEDWDEFVDVFSRLIYKTFHAPSFRFSKEEIDDLFNDFMILMLKDNFRKLRLFEGRNNCSLPSYLRKIAVNLAIDRQKRLIRRRTYSLNRPIKANGEEEFGDLMEGQAPEPNEPLQDDEERQHYLRMLYQLDVPKLLATILVIYHNELSRERIAEILQTSRQNVDVMFKRAKDRLMEIVSRKERATQREPEKIGWSDRIAEIRGAFLRVERYRLREKCLKTLTLSDELLVGLLFMDAAILEPTPGRLAALFKTSPELEIARTEKILGKITVP